MYKWFELVEPILLLHRACAKTNIIRHLTHLHLPVCFLSVFVHLGLITVTNKAIEVISRAAKMLLTPHILKALGLH